MADAPPPAVAASITATWREESARIVGVVTRLTRDLDLAEDIAQDALVAALERWPVDGVPDNPGAWLMTAAKRRTIDLARRSENLRSKLRVLAGTWEEVDPVGDLDQHLDQIEDDVLRLAFMCCDPALSADSRTALTLRLVGGLSTPEIARAFLVPEKTMGQRISRAKRTLSTAGITLELPDGAERTRRLDDVMAVIYLIFTEGYVATAGEDWARPDLAEEAIRLARLLATIAPDEPEVHGLLALVQLQASRMPARIDATGQPVLLDDQDRGRWDQLLIRRGLNALVEAGRSAARGRPVGRYYLQAAIAAEHARAASAAATDWQRIAELYDVLATAAPGPIVEVNRAVAYGRAHGPQAGLAVLAELPEDALPGSPLLPSVEGDLLERDGQCAAAAEAFGRAAALTDNAGERAILRRRAAANQAAR